MVLVVDSLRPIWDMSVHLGLEVSDPVPLRSTNNVVVWLRPTPVVVKATASPQNRLGWELEVATVLYDAGAPVGGPSALVEPVVHHHDGWHMSFWTYHPQTEGDAEPTAVARALAHLHEKLDGFNVDPAWSLPSWDEAPKSVLHQLADQSFACLLGRADRDLLRTALGAFGQVSELSANHGGLHGSPHSFNTLTVSGSPIFIDLETACRGPREWDLCHTDAAVTKAYQGSLSEVALKKARLIVSAMTSALCWDSIDRGPDMRFHAEHHLAQVRSAHT
jgi:Phosphotransferase enzyme family